MSVKPSQPCKQPGCYELRPCPDHPDVKAWATSKHTSSTRASRRIRAEVLKRDAHTCAQCGQPGNEVDHITPESEGGKYLPSNLQTLCSPCHRTKTQAEAARARWPGEVR